MRIRAVIFDLGGVVIGSPLHAIAAYERELGLATNAVNHVVVRSGPTGAWSRLERGELGLEEFYPRSRPTAAPLDVAIDAREMMRRVAEIAVPRPAMLEAIRKLRAGGLRVAALTNNWITEDAGHGRAARVLRRVRRVDRGRAAQARPAHLPARLPRARTSSPRRRCSSTTSAAT